MNPGNCLTTATLCRTTVHPKVSGGKGKRLCEKAEYKWQPDSPERRALLRIERRPVVGGLKGRGPAGHAIFIAIRVFTSFTPTRRGCPRRPLLMGEIVNKTKIDWCDYTWNPVWGCRNNCPYCYARATARRFGCSFLPHWRERNFHRSMPKEPGRIFVNSMSEIAYWEQAWWAQVLRRIRENPQHTFIFLTQSPEVYTSFDFPENCWLGVTITFQQEISERLFKIVGNVCFASVEPIQEQMDPHAFEDIDWVILGAETGNRKDRVIPPEEWIEPFLDLKTPLFMKDNLHWSGPLRREYP